MREEYHSDFHLGKSQLIKTGSLSLVNIFASILTLFTFITGIPSLPIFIGYLYGISKRVKPTALVQLITPNILFAVFIFGTLLICGITYWLSRSLAYSALGRRREPIPLLLFGLAVYAASMIAFHTWFIVCYSPLQMIPLHYISTSVDFYGWLYLATCFSSTAGIIQAANLYPFWNRIYNIVNSFERK